MPFHRRRSAFHRRRSALSKPFAVLAAMFVAVAVHAADPRKVIRIAFPSGERGFDCARESDESTGTLCDNIFDSLLQYDHLARPIRLQPRAAVAMPEITDGGRTYTFRIKPGIYFTPDPAFKGVHARAGGRRLRLQPEALLRSRRCAPSGRSCSRARSRAPTHSSRRPSARASFDYDRPIEGLQAPSKYEFRAEAERARLQHALHPRHARHRRPWRARWSSSTARRSPSTPWAPGPTSSACGAAPRSSSSRPTPTTARTTSPPRAARTSATRRSPRTSQGKRLPLVGRIEISVIEEHQPRWLAFLNGEHDYIRPLPAEFIDMAMPGGKLAPNLARQGIAGPPRRGRVDHLHDVQHEGPHRGRLHAGEDRAAPRHRARLPDPRGDRDHLQEPGDQGRLADRARHGGLHRRDAAPRSSTTRPRPRRCSTCTATSTATATAGARCPTARRW